MADFEVKLSTNEDGLIIYTAANAELLTTPMFVDDLTKKMLMRFNHWVGIKDEYYERDDLEILGHILFQLLLPKDSKLRERFKLDYRQFINQSESDTDRFRLTLEIHENAGEMAQYPWEFLFIPRLGDEQLDDGFFVSGERNRLILTRHVPKGPPKLVPQKPDELLRILIIFAHPKEDGLGELDSKEMREFIGKIESIPGVVTRLSDNPTHTELMELVPDFAPHIVHFITHGDAVDGLALMRDRRDIELDKANDKRPLREAHWCNAHEIRSLFARHNPHLVFLQACESAMEAKTGLTSLARDLVNHSVPSVVAMQYSIKVGDAVLFARTFYEKIGAGSRIDEAVRVGREVFGRKQDNRKMFSDRRFATPVVYFQQKCGEALILKTRRSESQQPRPTSQDTPVVPRTCPRCDGECGEYSCTVCGFRFYCTCGHKYVNPKNKYCGMCPLEIVQPTYEPTTASLAPPNDHTRPPHAVVPLSETEYVNDRRLISNPGRTEPPGAKSDGVIPFNGLLT